MFQHAITSVFDQWLLGMLLPVAFYAGCEHAQAGKYALVEPVIPRRVRVDYLSVL